MRFVDLYKVVREGIRVSEPSYSLKNLETFYMEKREGAVATAGDSVVVYNRWRETGDDQLLKQIADYNEIDCISTGKLRDWLLKLRPPQYAWFDGPPPVEATEKAREWTTARLEREARYADYQKRLLESATGEDDFRRHLADLLEFHAREEKPQWWEFFDRQTRSTDELIDDAECIAGLTLAMPAEPVKQSLLYTYRFPPQETKRLEPVNKSLTWRHCSYAGTIKELDDENQIVKIKLGLKSGRLPENLNIGPGGPVNSDALREAIYRFATKTFFRQAEQQLSRGNDATCSAKRHCLAFAGHSALDSPIVRRRRPACRHDRGRRQASIIPTCSSKGRPGSGKTHTSAHVIVELIRRGKKIGVAANSHKVIHNLLDTIEEFDGH